MQEFLEWYQASQDDVIRIREQAAESKPSKALNRTASRRMSKANRMSIRASKGSFHGQKGASRRQGVALEAATSEMQLAAHTFVQVRSTSRHTCWWLLYLLRTP